MQDKRNIENVVHEIMVLVDALSVECISFGIGQIECSKEDRVLLGEDVKKARSHLESKLRDLVENSFSVREPLSDEQRLLMWQRVSLRGVAKPSYDAWFQAGVSAAERAHNITKDS